MGEERQLWNPGAWMARSTMPRTADNATSANPDFKPELDAEEMVTARAALAAPRIDPEMQETLPRRAVNGAGSARAARSPAPDRVAPERGAGIAAPRQQSHKVRWLSALLAVLLLTLTNAALQVNRRPFDVLSEHFPDAALARVQRCESLGRPADVLYMGSSLTMHAVMPTQVDAVAQADFGQRILSCNMAEDGSTFEEDYYTLKRVIEDGYTPKLIVETLWEYNVDAHGSPPADTNPLPAEQILSLADISDVGRLTPHFGSGLNGKLAAANYVAGKAIPFYGDRTGIFKSLCGQLSIGPCASTVTTSLVATPLQKMVLPSDSRGWVALVGRSLATYTLAQLRPYTACGNNCPPFVIGGSQPAYLSDLLSLAQAHHIRVALVIPPFSRYFFNVLRPADWQKLVAFWRSYATTPGVSFFDVSHDPTYLTTDFWDIHHLDAVGAKKFSTWVGQTLVPQELLGRGQLGSSGG